MATDEMEPALSPLPYSKGHLRTLVSKNLRMLKRNKGQVSSEIFNAVLYVGLLIGLSFTVTQTDHPEVV
jgi:hypothetical protein